MAETQKSPNSKVAPKEPKAAAAPKNAGSALGIVRIDR